LACSGSEIETPRLRLRPLTPEDLDAIHRIWTDPEVRRYLWDGEEVSGEAAAGVISDSAAYFDSRGLGLLAVIPKELDEPIGFCGFWRFEGRPGFELAYGLAPAWWGKGLATEAARAVIRYGFEEAGLGRIEASVDTPNAASLRVMENAGMKYTKREVHEGRDTTYYAISREDFRAANRPTAAPG
jgi:[ribosomal protein S5]-alanine N-acetyltransferase